MFIRPTTKPIRLKTKTGEWIVVHPHQTVQVSDATGRKLIRTAPDQIRRMKG